MTGTWPGAHLRAPDVYWRDADLPVLIWTGSGIYTENDQCFP
jgi:hypothetical protein